MLCGSLHWWLGELLTLQPQGPLPAPQSCWECGMSQGQGLQRTLAPTREGGMLDCASTLPRS